MKPAKKDLNYKVIMGMRAVGNQCRDCKHSYSQCTAVGKSHCLLMEKGVSESGHCDGFQGAE